MEVPHKALLRSIDVRWSSMYLMLSRFVENKTAINLFLLNDSLKKYPRFSYEEWAMMIALLEILEPLYKSTNYVQARNAPISTILPSFLVLKKKWCAEANDATKKYGEVKLSIIRGLESRLQGWKKKRCLTLATILHPRFQLRFFDDVSSLSRN